MNTRPIDPHLVIRVVEDYHYLARGTLFDINTRRQLVTRPRTIAMVLIRSLCSDLSLSDIGTLFDADHSTVLYACQRWDSTYVNDPVLKQRFLNCKALVEASSEEVKVIASDRTIRYCRNCNAFFLMGTPPPPWCPVCKRGLVFPDRQAINIFRSVLIQAQVGSNGKDESSTPDNKCVCRKVNCSWESIHRAQAADGTLTANGGLVNG